MIELTTGVVFLLSSMYGAGHSNTEVIAQDVAVADSNEKARVEEMIDVKEVEKYLRENYADTPLLIEIARCESGFTHYRKDGNVLRGRVDNRDVGVMQINEHYHLERAEKLGFDIHTIDGNIGYAKRLYQDQGAAPWSASSSCWSKSYTSKQIAKK
jgi:hypothetical protein